MILQNKKTGVLGVLEAWTCHGGRPDNIIEVYEMGMGAVRVLAQYKTLEELLGEWEDYKPTEPLIKGEKIRKAVRAWADANYIEKDGHNGCKVEFDRGEHRLKWIETSIEFNEITGLENLEEGEIYTINELCGEEEAPEPIEPTFVDLDERIKEKEEK